jgi:hypothetical protein
MQFKILKRTGSFGRAVIQDGNGLIFEITGGRSDWYRKNRPLRWFTPTYYGRKFPLPRYREDGDVHYFSFPNCFHELGIWNLHSRQIDPGDLARLPEAEQKRANLHCAKHWPTKRIICHKDGTYDWWFPCNGWHYDRDHFSKEALLWMPIADQNRILRHLVKFGYWEDLTSVSRSRWESSTLFTAERAKEVLETIWGNPWQWCHHSTIY